jgi:hypothetical protein
MYELMLEGTIGIRKFANEETLSETIKKIVKDDNWETFKIRKLNFFQTDKGTVREKLFNIFNSFKIDLSIKDLLDISKIKESSIKRELSRMINDGLIQKKGELWGI